MPAKLLFLMQGANCDRCLRGFVPQKMRKACVCRSKKVRWGITHQLQISVCAAGQYEVGGKCVCCRISFTGSMTIYGVCVPQSGFDKTSWSYNTFPDGAAELEYTTADYVKSTEGRKLHSSNCPQGEVSQQGKDACTKCPAGCYAAFDKCHKWSGDIYQPLTGQSSCC